MAAMALIAEGRQRSRHNEEAEAYPRPSSMFGCGAWLFRKLVL